MGRFNYANVTATLALFVALGGTSYAVATLPRNSVGPKQIRPDAVGASELRSRSIRSKHIHDGSVALKDVSLRARRALRGQRGPTGPQGQAGPSGVTVSAAVDAAGRVAAATPGAVGTHLNAGSGIYDVRFDRDFRQCRAVASLSRVEGTTPSDPDAGEIVTSTTERGVVVKTRNSQGMPKDLPFHVIVVC